MARLFIDGFESGNLKLWDTIYGAPVVDGATKYSGNYALKTGQGDNSLLKNISSISTLYFSLRFYCHYYIGSFAPITFRNAAGFQITIYINSSAKLEIRLGDRSGSVLATGASIFSMDTWYRISGKVVIDNAAGEVNIKVNGINEVSFSGDTQYQATGGITGVQFGNYASGGSGGYPGYFDDFVLDDAVWVGDTRIQAIKPAVGGVLTEWTPSVGSNWSCVDDIPQDENDYVAVNAVDKVDLYGATDLIGSIEAVKCVQVQALAVKGGAPTPQNLQLACRTGGSNYFGDSQAVPDATSKSLAKIWETNPNTSVAWTEEDVNGMEIGIKSAT